MKRIQEPICVIAAEGLNRSGKGTQLQLLQNWLAKDRISSVIIRGDGSRPGSGCDEGDPHDSWWQGFHSTLRNLPPTDRQELWLTAACRLASEFKYWRYDFLPEKMESEGNRSGVLLVDRSLISRLSIVREFRPLCQLEHLYTDGNKEDQTWKQVLPNLIISLEVEQTVLLERLDNNDPKREFRERLIRECYTHHCKVLLNLPAVLKSITYSVNGARRPKEVAEDVIGIYRSLLQQHQLRPAV